MKKSYIKLMTRDMRGSFSRFLSILGIVGLGVAVLIGLLCTTPDMQHTVQRYCDEHNLYDINIKSTLGITDEDIEAVAAFEGVQHVTPGHVTDVVVEDRDGNIFVARLYSVPFERMQEGDLNRFDLLAGTLPATPTECLVSTPTGHIPESLIGGRYVISQENKDPEDLPETYKHALLQVVGTAKTPLYYSTDSEPSNVGTGQVDLIFFVREDFYSLNVYTDLFLSLSEHPGETIFSAEYSDYVTALTEGALGDFADERAALRYETVVREANDKLADAEEAYFEAKDTMEQEFADAEDELKDAQWELVQAQEELDAVPGQLQNAEAQLYGTIRDQADQILQQMSPLLDDAYASGSIDLETYNAMKDAMIAASGSSPAEVKNYIARYRNWLNNGGARYFPIMAEQLKIGLVTGRINQEQYDAALAGLNAMQTIVPQVDAAQAQIDNGWTQYNEGLQDIREAWWQIEEGWREYEEAKLDAEEQLADAWEQIEEGRLEIARIEKAEWIVFTLEDNVSYSSFRDNAEKVAAVSRVFPIFFFLVAALVALTTMTRMVEEQRTQIGTLKALGYSNGALIFYYMLYSISASLIGSILGVTVGLTGFPLVIYNAYINIYSMPPLDLHIWWQDILFIVPTAVVVTCLATLFACLAQLREKPSILMVPKAPAVGKRVLLERVDFVWKRLTFTQKVTVRNLFRYKKRLFMSVIGVAGCTGLLVAGFGIRDSIGDIANKQFGDIYRHNAIVLLKDALDDSTDEAVTALLDDTAVTASYAPIHAETARLRSNGQSKPVNLYVPRTAQELSSHINFRLRIGGDAVPFDEDSFLLTEKVCEQLGISVGDTVELVNADNLTEKFVVTGICENYVENYAYLPGSRYFDAFLNEPSYSTVLAQFTDTGDAAQDSVTEALLASDDVSYVQFLTSVADSFNVMLGSIDYIVIVIIACAGLLAFIVLYNLTNINVCERKKELATLKVLGFHDRETAMYIYRETLLLTLMGAAVGLLLGMWLHRFIILTVEVDIVMFGRSVYPISYVYSFLMTVVFSLFVDWFMLRGLRAIDMVESMKAGE